MGEQWLVCSGQVMDYSGDMAGYGRWTLYDGRMAGVQVRLHYLIKNVNTCWNVSHGRPAWSAFFIVFAFMAHSSCLTLNSVMYLCSRV